ncbi:glycosyltransferase [Microbacterium sp.]|uniref:glycosyltransferase n=1 Tax=Microbacterium sp. TaxID=51671 RepID=UPI002735B2DA|nr:glycosyltransferase [Microbacterium sp.]MDP3949810.1 glycosyltransferase [Microbacterium sp.]
MPTPVHAIIVSRPGSSARAQLLRTLDALTLQTRRADAITLVVCGDGSDVRASDVVAGLVEGIIQARGGTSYADAVELARPRVADGAAMWLLAQDTAPHPHALAQLAGALERSPSAAIAAPKLVNADNERELVSLGVTMTTLGRSVELAAGELDQGQHDRNDDALGADIRGILVRSEMRDRLRPDPALAGADEGLALGVRARLAGARVVLAPSARVSVSPDGPAALPRNASQRAYATRLAQLHRRLSYAPAAAVPLHWLSLLPLALWRTIVHLIGKRPASVFPEWGAAIMAMVRVGAVARSRQSIRSSRTANWSSIAPLRITRAQLHRRLDDGHGSEGGALSALNFFSGGGAWAVLGALVVGVASFFTLLAWPALGGGALLPLRNTVAALWEDAAWGQRGIGVGIIGPADPFSGVVAVLGTLWAGAPSFAVVLLWLLALPLAVLGGWFAATRITDRGGLRIFGGVAWALAPTFLTALVEGRPAAVLLHLLLPWLFHAAVVAHRSWGAAGAASILLAAVLACAPALAPGLGLLWAVALVIVLTRGWFHGAVRLLWLLAPTAVLFAPLVIWHVRGGNLWAIFADPGLVWAGPQVAADSAGRMLLATGFPTADLAGWTDVIDPAIAVWAPLLIAPLVLLALAAAIAPRWGAGITLLVVAMTGLATAFLCVGVTVSFAQGVPVEIWPGSGLSLAWVGVVGAALVTLDTAVTLPRLRVAAVTVAGLALAVCAVPALTALHTDRTVLTDGPESTLPAFVAAEAKGDREIATLVLTPQNDGGLAAEVVWGASETLGAQTSMLSTATEPQGTDISALSVDLLSTRTFDAPGELAAHGIHFVLLDQIDAEETDAARAFRVAAVTALDQRAGFVKVGETDKGVLWRLEATPSERASLSNVQEGTATAVTALQLIVLFAALLLAIPTRASRRAARAQSRIVGRSPEEPMVLPRRADDRLDDEPHDEQQFGEEVEAIDGEHADADENVDADESDDPDENGDPDEGDGAAAQRPDAAEESAADMPDDSGRELTTDSEEKR